MKRLLIVDPDFLRSSPSMKGVLRSLPELRAAGFKIEVWCWEIESDVAVNHVTRLPTLGARKLKLMQAILFSIQVTLLYLWRFQVRGQSRPDVVYSIVPYLPFCDVAHAHFSPWNWIGCMERMGCHSLRDRAELMAYQIYRRWSDFYLSVTSARLLIVPSQAVAEDYQRQSPGHQIVVLPNSFDRARFHPGVRAEHGASPAEGFFPRRRSSGEAAAAAFAGSFPRRRWNTLHAGGLAAAFESRASRLA
jgi:hypothetical protein